MHSRSTSNPKKLNELSRKEQWLVVALRERFRHGKVEVQMRDGRVVRIVRAWESAEAPDD